MAVVYFPVQVRPSFPSYLSRWFKCKAHLTAEESVHSTRLTFYSQRLTVLMMGFPWIFTKSLIGLYLCGISIVEELFTCYCFTFPVVGLFFSFCSTKKGIV